MELKSQINERIDVLRQKCITLLNKQDFSHTDVICTKRILKQIDALFLLESDLSNSTNDENAPCSGQQDSSAPLLQTDPSEAGDSPLGRVSSGPEDGEQPKQPVARASSDRDGPSTSSLFSYPIENATASTSRDSQRSDVGEERDSFQPPVFSSAVTSSSAPPTSGSALQSMLRNYSTQAVARPAAPNAPADFGSHFSDEVSAGYPQLSRSAQQGASWTMGARSTLPPPQFARAPPQGYISSSTPPGTGRPSPRTSSAGDFQRPNVGAFQATARFEDVESRHVCFGFWARGECQKGTSCDMKHVYAPIPGQHRALGALCQAFSETGFCHNGPECPNAHVPREEITKPGRVLCVYQLKGFCNGRCTYAHWQRSSGLRKNAQQPLVSLKDLQMALHPGSAEALLPLLQQHPGILQTNASVLQPDVPLSASTSTSPFANAGFGNFGPSALSGFVTEGRADFNPSNFDIFFSQDDLHQPGM